MPDLATFARRIRRRGRMVENKVNKTVIETAMAIDQAVVLATPVDTGRARANWQASIGAPLTEALDETDKGGQATIAKSASVIRGREPEQTIFLSNNVEYIVPLNAGSSSQAPANFVEIAVKAGIALLRRRKVTV